MAQLPQCRNPPAASEYFCSNTACVFHVRVGDPGVLGSGDWCTTDAGVTASHRWVDGRLLCDLCALQTPRTRS